jgi:hypothetical protein
MISRIDFFLDLGAPTRCSLDIILEALVRDGGSSPRRPRCSHAPLAIRPQVISFCICQCRKACKNKRSIFVSSNRTRSREETCCVMKRSKQFVARGENMENLQQSFGQILISLLYIMSESHSFGIHDSLSLQGYTASCH